MKSLLLLVTAAAGVLLLLMPHYTHAQCNNATEMSALVGSLFSGVSNIPRNGGFSKLLTFKQTACLVLIGNDVSHGLMAAATLGAGKLLITTNYRLVESYNTDLERNTRRRNFHINLRSWLKGGSTAVWDECTITSSSQMMTCINDPNVKTLLYYYGTPLDLSPQDEAAVEAWISSGNGSLIYAFRQDIFEANTVESASKIPLYSVILAAGVAFEGVSASAPWKIPLPTNATELLYQNLYTVSSALTWDNFENSALLTKARNLVLNSERYFPPYVSNKFFQVFEDFAVSMETNMTPWPNATLFNLTNTDTSTRQQNMYKIYYAMMRAQLWQQVHPTAHLYPGDVANPVVITSPKNFSFTSQTKRRFVLTGLYLFPGKVMTITVTNPAGDDTWKDFKLYIGSDTDKLQSKDSLRRIPLVNYQEYLVDRVSSMFWAPGGLIYFYAPDGLNKNLMVTISGDVSDTPYLDAINDDVATINAVWTGRCTNSPGLTADFYGEYIRFAIPVTPGICDFTGQHYRDLLLKYDRAVQAAYELRGGDKLKQAAVHSMIQLSIGALHSGFPIAARAAYGIATDIKYVLNTLINEQDWPVLHELGHEVDHQLMFQGETAETSANVFALFNYVRWIYHENLEDVFKITEALSSSKLRNWLLDPSFTSGNYNKWTRFLIYFQLIRDFGWSCQREVFRSLVEDPNPPSGSDAERNDLVMRWSNLVEYNLCPLFEFWHWPVTTACSNINPIFPPYLPDDVITSMTEAANLTASVLAVYTSISRSVPTGHGNSTCPAFTILPAP